MNRKKITYIVLINAFFLLISILWLTPNIEGDGITYYVMTKLLVERGGGFNPEYVPEDIPNIRRTVSRIDERPGFLYSCGYAFFYYPFLRLSGFLPDRIECKDEISRYPSISNRDVLGITMGTVFYTLGSLIIGFLLLIRYFPYSCSFISIFALYLGTPFFYYSQFSPSYAHALVIFLLSLSLWIFLIILDKKDTRTAVLYLLLGISTGSSILVQNFNLIYILPYFSYIIILNHRFSKKNIISLVCFSLGVLPFAIILGIYNYSLYGEVLTSGYLHIAHEFPDIDRQFSISAFNLPKYFFSPSRGILMWAPLFLISMFGIFPLWKRKKIFYLFLSVLLTVFIFMNFYTIWHGGKSFGPRILMGLFPYLIIMLASLIVRYKKAVPVLMLICVLYTMFFANFFMIYEKAITDRQDRKILGENHKVGSNLSPLKLYEKVNILIETRQNKNTYCYYLIRKKPSTLLYWILN